MDAEVRVGGGLDPVRLLAEVDVVEVRGEDAVLAPLLVELNREAGFGELPAERLLRREVEVADELLLDRRPALSDPARRDVALQRAHDPDVVDAVVRVEAAVLGVDDRLPHHGADPPQGDGLASPARAEQPESRPVPGHEDARLRSALRLEAVEAARVPEERPRDSGADSEGADEHNDACCGDLQPQLQAPCARVAISHTTFTKRHRAGSVTGSNGLNARAGGRAGRASAAATREPAAPAAPAPAVAAAAAPPRPGASSAAPLPARAGRGSPRSSLRAATPRSRSQGTPQRRRLLSYARDAMCFDVDSSPPIPRISGAAVSHEDLVLEAATATASRPSGAARRSRRDRRRRSSRTSAASTASTRSSRCASPSAATPRSRSTTSAAPPASTKRADDWDYMPHVAAADAGADPGRRRRASRALRCAAAACSAIFTVGFCFGGRDSWLAAAAATASPAPSASTGARASATAQPGRSARRGDRGADPRAAGRRRPGHPAEDNAAFERGAARRGRRARGRHVPGRAAQLLRPQAGGVPGGVRGRLAAHARLHPGAFVGPSVSRSPPPSTTSRRATPRRDDMAELVADYFLKRLREWGVHRIYGYPGDGINAFLGALDRADGDPEFIQARHEEMAAFMACGHAKFTGEVGVCMATSGPGAIHLLNGLYDAKLDHAPVRRDRRPAEAHVARRALPAGGRPAGRCSRTSRSTSSTAWIPAQARHLVDRGRPASRSTERGVATIIFPSGRRRRRRRVESPPRTHGSVYSSVGYSRRAWCRRTSTSSARPRSSTTGEKVAMLVGQGARGAADEVVERRRHARRRRRQGAARHAACCPTTCRSSPARSACSARRPSYEMMEGCDTLLDGRHELPVLGVAAEGGPGAAACEIDIDGRHDRHPLPRRRAARRRREGDAARAARRCSSARRTAAGASRSRRRSRDWWDVVERPRDDGRRPDEPAARGLGALAAAARGRDPRRRLRLVDELVRAPAEAAARATSPRSRGRSRRWGPASRTRSPRSSRIPGAR